MRIIALVIILSGIFITLAVAEAPKAAPSLPSRGGIGIMESYLTNNTYHLLDLYFDQYGEPMTGAVVSNTLENTSDGIHMEKSATINSDGYAVVNFKVNNTNLLYLASYNAPLLPPLNASSHNGVGCALFGPLGTNQDSNFTYNNIFDVQGRYSYEAAFLFFHYNSEGYGIPTRDYRLFYSNNYSAGPPFPMANSFNNSLPSHVLSGYLNLGQIGKYAYSIVYPDYRSIPKSNLSKAGLLFGFPQVYNDGGWENVSVDNYIVPYYVPQIYLPPSSELLIAPIYSVFFGFPSIIPVLLGIISEVVVFGLPRSSGNTDLYLSRSGSRTGLMLKRMLGPLILLLLSIILGFVAFLTALFYYTGIFPTPGTDVFVILSLFLVGSAFVSLSFLVSSRARSTTVNVLAPIAIFFGLFYLLDNLLTGLYSLLITDGIALNPILIYAIEILDPFNVLTSMEVDLVPKAKVVIPVPLGFGLVDYMTILVTWSLIPALAAFILWRKAE